MRQYELTPNGIDQLISDVEQKQKFLREKSDELAKRLAKVGEDTAREIMGQHVFDGDTLASLHTEHRGPAHYAVRAESEGVLFLEYGSGLKGYGHPEPEGYGPGTYPGQTHAFSPSGWWFRTDDPRLIRRYDKKGQGWGHSYGNAPAMPMYNGVKSVEQNLQKVAEEVFNSNDK